jgi:hypothetical protein
MTSIQYNKIRTIRKQAGGDFMFVGPFFFLNSPRFKQKGLHADLCPLEQAVTRERRQTSPVTHQELLERIAPGENSCDHPRGQVVYDLESKMAIIFIDRCIEQHLDEVVRLFELPAWVIEYDDQFVCPRCDRLADRF